MLVICIGVNQAIMQILIIDRVSLLAMVKQGSIRNPSHPSEYRLSAIKFDPKAVLSLAKLRYRPNRAVALRKLYTVPSSWRDAGCLLGSEYERS